MARYSDGFLDTLLAGYKRALRMDDKKMIRQVLSVCEEIGIIRNDRKRNALKVNKRVDNQRKCGIMKVGMGGRAARADADPDDGDGHWVTTENGHKVYINGEGEPEKGNPNVLSTMSGGGPKGGGVTYEKTHTAARGTAFPKIKTEAAWDADTLKEVDRLAKEGNKEDAYDEVVSKLTESDVVYQTDPEGQVVSAVPGLSQMYDNKVVGKSDAIQASYEERIERGKQITNDMIEISDSLGSRMLGLENCFKGGASTARKIDKVKAKKGFDSDEEALAHMDDVVRYTFKSDHKSMVANVLSFEEKLKDKGYDILERDNKYLPDPGGKPKEYKAIHLQALSPSGEKFEIQIHSEETISVKNMNHALFEEQRKLPAGDPRIKTLGDEMAKNWAGLEDPAGIMKLESFKK